MSKLTVLSTRADAFGGSTPTATVFATGDRNIDALLSGTKWASTSISFSFTDSISDYEFGYQDRASHAVSFRTLNATQRAAARKWIGTGGEFYNVSNLITTELTGASDRDATIRMASSNVPPTAFAYYPANTVEGGDAWFNRIDYNTPVIGNYAYHTFGHELGHALGLKHGHELGGVGNVALSADRDSMEFSIMTYRSYVGDPLIGGYSNETWGYAQSLMMYDIRAIQEMYGAWFGYNSTDTTYTFSTTTGQMSVNGVGQGLPGANRIFRTVWDGNGIDTYDFSNYTTNLSVDLTPGGWSDLNVGGNAQRSYLGDGNYARGHVFNALQYRGDTRSLIENAKGGLGNDTITGNIANNTLYGNGGNDSINGGAGVDTIYGGDGNDTADGGDGNDLIYLGNGDDYLNVLSLGNDIFYGGLGNDYIYGYTGNETYYGEDGNDSLLGFSGNDILSGGAGIDTIYGGDGNDTADGGDGNDLIYLGNGDDYLNVLSLGNDTFYGGAGNDYIYGYTGNEIYYGEDGNDSLLGSSGNDILNGGSGKDTLTGGSGVDTFDYTTLTNSLLAAYDVITDYAIGDKINAPANVIATTLTASRGNASSLSATAISLVLSSSVFAANSARAFQVTGFAGTFIALNNGVAGFNAATDSIIFLQNYTLGSAAIV